MSWKRKKDRRKKPTWIQINYPFCGGIIGPKLKQRIEELAWFDSEDSLDGPMVFVLVSTCSYCGKEKEIITRIWNINKKKVARICRDCMEFLA